MDSLGVLIATNFASEEFLMGNAVLESGRGHKKIDYRNLK